MRCDLIDLGLSDYPAAGRYQSGEQDRIKKSGGAALIFAEFRTTYTIGRRGSLDNLLVSQNYVRDNGIEIYHTNRGGDITVHSPGQLVTYPIFNLAEFKKNLDWYLRSLEQAIINLLAGYGITAGRRNGLTGVWVENKKIAFIGISVSKWVTSHGLSLNINNDLGLFDLMNPCGIRNCPVTSVSEIKGRRMNMDDIKNGLLKEFESVFGITIDAQKSKSVLA